MDNPYQITVVISTYNRSDMLHSALDSVLVQEDPGVPYEVIVVNNNSTDSTGEILESYLKRHSNLRYVFEGRQGVSYARNTGLAHARAPIIAFADDDVRVSKDWIAGIKREFEAHPDVDCIGGRVLPRWTTPAPAWLTREQWMPLALQDYGDEPFYVDALNPLCLVSANLAFRRTVFAETGLFSTDLQRIKDGIGSTEDAELLERYWRTGRRCLYVPDLLVETDVPPDRMTMAYHRRWHAGHGHFLAIMRSEELERASGRLFDVPAHLYKQAIENAAGWLRCVLLGNRARAFLHETRLRFFRGFVQKRRQDYLAAEPRGTLREIAAFIGSLASHKHRAMSAQRHGRGVRTH
jgi:glycosyltransferase involved in cell wall biosynthesis